MPYANASLFISPLNSAMLEFEISLTLLREAAFLAQVAYESGELRWLRELASGNEYEGRTDLGNVDPGDGPLYKGRGLLQITGKTNYLKCGEALDLPLLQSPELLEQPENAARSAGWFWNIHGLNELADSENFLLITKRINGGTNGYAKRLAYFEKAKQILGAFN